MRRNVGRKPQTSANLAAFLHIIDTSRLLKALRNDKRAIFRAATASQAASELILSHMSAPVMARAA
ncbi:MAG: hypothetical protein B7X90_11845 [Novosphingobium sp. 17-62-19]|uniref:hypothetical protein n=1 Tax=Novosphingobium sp. 17-62-19 TaxID=1970406 RepID=UPI000BC846E1|nr:hypothetical protein [Novosphingobium sp. 17-62-19]OYX96367.1 MAG: hypothetical protein B7Y74_01550 [Novosphingobium sp. 35-62-5]OZA18588.1 MAG: hypothetical protein B7X90_11845 [Novosphingobium sp. 17-62-19]